MGTESLEDSAVQPVAGFLRKMGATQEFLFRSATKGGLSAYLYFSAVSKASDILARPVA